MLGMRHRILGKRGQVLNTYYWFVGTSPGSSYTYSRAPNPSSVVSCVHPPSLSLSSLAITVDFSEGSIHTAWVFYVGNTGRCCYAYGSLTSAPGKLDLGLLLLVGPEKIISNVQESVCILNKSFVEREQP